MKTANRLTPLLTNRGRTLLTRLGRGNQQADTYFVFDRFGRIRYVLPPMINDEISAGNLDLYAYQYLYDSFDALYFEETTGLCCNTLCL